MRVLSLIVVPLLMLFAHALAGLQPVDLSEKSEAGYRNYIGHFVRVTGRLAVRGKFGPFIDTGKAQVYLAWTDPSILDPALDGQRLSALGTLRFQPEISSATPSKAAVLSFLYFGSDCTLHYFGPTPDGRSNPAIQLTATRFEK